MKKVFILFTTIMSLICTLCHSQEKKDSKIIVTASDTASLFDRVALAFYEKGFTLEQKDEKVKFLATADKTLKSNANFDYRYRALIKGNQITFFGEIALNHDFIVKTKTKQFDPIEFRGTKGSAFRDTWDEMESIARQFGTEIRYSK